MGIASVFTFLRPGTTVDNLKFRFFATAVISRGTYAVAKKQT